MSLINHLVDLGFDFIDGLTATNATIHAHEETIKKLCSAESLSIKEFEMTLPRDAR